MLVLFWPTFFWGRCVWVLAGSINNTQVTTALKAEKNKCFLVKLKKKKNAIVEYLDYQIPVTQLMGPKGNADMQAAKRY